MGETNRFITKGCVALLIFASMMMMSVTIIPENASASTWSSTVKVFSSTGTQYLDGDIAKGVNYLYAISSEYADPGRLFIKRSVNGSTWSAPITVLSGLNHPHGGFCAYTVSGIDNILVSSLGYVRKSTDNGGTFTSLSNIGTSLDYNTVATNASMNPSLPYDNCIYIAGNLKEQYNGIYMRKSINDGSSWGSLRTIAGSNCFWPVLTRNSTTLFCIYGMLFGDLYVKSSADWGRTWSAATKIATKTQGEAVPGHVQYIDEQKCLLTYEDIADQPYSNSRGYYGYFWFSNLTFQKVGLETGSSYNNPDPHAYSGLLYNDSVNIKYTSLWGYCVTPYVTSEVLTHSSNGLVIVNYTPPSPPVEHKNTYVNGGASLSTQAAVEGWPGDGTEEHPYIIDDYFINSTTNNGIHICNTNDYFVISNVTVKSQNHACKGVYLNNADNGRLENITCSGNSYGIYAVGSDNLELYNCKAESSSGNGIYLVSCNGVDAKNIEVKNNGNHGLHTTTCQNVNISNVVASWNAWHGMFIRLLTDVSIYACRADNNGLYGIYVSGCTNVEVKGAGVGTASGNVKSGIMMTECTGTLMIDQMTINSNGWYGVQNISSATITLSGCTLIGNNFGQKSW